MKSLRRSHLTRATLRPNRRLQLTDGDRFKKRSVVRWRARTIVQRHGALRARRPQRKRTPLGSSSTTRLHDRKAMKAFVVDRYSKSAVRLGEMPEPEVDR